MDIFGSGMAQGASNDGFLTVLQEVYHSMRSDAPLHTESLGPATLYVPPTASDSALGPDSQPQAPHHLVEREHSVYDANGQVAADARGNAGSSAGNPPYVESFASTGQIHVPKDVNPDQHQDVMPVLGRVNDGNCDVD